MQRFFLRIGAPAIIFLLSAPSALAESEAAKALKGGLTDTAKLAGYQSTSLPVIIGNVIKALLGVVGIIFLLITIYAGIMYMTAAGDTGKVDKAKKMLTQSLIGLVIIIGAYAFANFVVTQLAVATTAAPVKK
ncbi:hypothetical protein HZA85_01640 [Candidatus Uhrbacteria bacterium]|nr:hypothetical protein [Candidatus Uhrbacteria bacterium]